MVRVRVWAQEVHPLSQEMGDAEGRYRSALRAQRIDLCPKEKRRVGVVSLTGKGIELES